MEYIWYRNGKPLKHTQDIEGEIVTKDIISDGEYVEYKYHENGHVYAEFHHKNNVKHRDGQEPAFVWYHENGQVQEEKYFKNGKFHRDGDKPAHVWYHENGQVKGERYYKNGVEYTP